MKINPGIIWIHGQIDLAMTLVKNGGYLVTMMYLSLKI